MAITKIGTPELFDFSATNTALQLPTGDTASRPTSPSTGEWRFNSELKYVEYYDGADWFQIDTDAQVGPFTPSENFNVNTYVGNGATQAIDAKFNEAANFNGTTSIIALPSSSSISQVNNFSLSFWVKPRGFAASGYGTVVKFYSNYRNYVDIRPNGILGFDTTGSQLDTPNNSITDGVWQHVALTKSSTAGTVIYINGISVATNSLDINNANSFSGYINYLGGWDGSSYGFPGSIDQFRIFNKVLTAAQAEDLYTDETTTTASTLNFPAGAGCIAAYQLDGNGDDISTNYNATSTTDIGYTGLKFQPDLVWIKARNGTGQPTLFDSVRGVSRFIESSSSADEDIYTSYGVTAFNSTGVSLGDQSNGGYRVNGSSGGTYSGTPPNYVSWNWKAGGAPTATNSAGAGNVPTSGSVMIDGVASTAALAGTIAATNISANTAAGFSIISYTGASPLSPTIGHGLDSTPEMIIQKKTNGSEDWFVYFPPGVIDATTFYYYIVLNSTAGKGTTGSTAPTTTTFNPVSTSGDYIAYAFHSVAGYSKIGTYAGNGNSTGPVVDTGFEPAWVMIKSSNSDDGGGGAWIIYDNKRSTSNPRNKRLYANYDYAELTSSNYDLDFLTASPKGFQPKYGASSWGFNTSGVEYIYMAFAAT